MAKSKIADKETTARLNLIKQADDAKNVQNLVTKPMMDEYNRMYDHSDKFMSNELLTFANMISSSRINMMEQQLPQALMLLNPETPRVYTGYEHEVGKYSRSYYQTDRAWKIVHKISRYKNHPDLMYYLVVTDQNGIFDIIQRKPGESLTESYGFLNNCEVIDSKSQGNMIRRGEILYKSSAFDASMNYRYGKNAKTVYISCTKVTEDAIWAAKEFADSLEYCTITTIEASINGNEVPLNLFGNDSIYKIHPDIGEDTRLGCLCGKRKISNKSVIHSLQDKNLRNVIQDEDEVYYANGKVIGIDVFCNKKIDEIERAPYNSQILYYYEEQQAFYHELKTKLGKIVNSNPDKVSDRLRNVYNRACDLVSNQTIVNGNSKFENMVIVFTVMNIKHAGRGSKISGRFGEKGVIGTITPKADMPCNQYGEHVDLVLSPQGVFGRLNMGQWIEQELTFLADCIVRDLKMHNIPYEVGMPKILEFVNDVNRKEFEQLYQFYYGSDPNGQMAIYADIMERGLSLLNPPFWDNVTFTELSRLYKKYPYPRYKMTYKGEPIIRRLIMGTKYVMLLKQTPESKYSARSLGMQSALGHPSKSIKFKKHQLPHSDTPIRIGEMELMNLCMMNDPQAVSDFLSIYANSQLNREEFVKTILTTQNPLDIRYEVKRDEVSINRKMMNVLCKGGGSRLVG